MGLVPGILLLSVSSFKQITAASLSIHPPSKVSKFLLNHRASSDSEAEITA